jgi:membrane protein YdbS with pleckstrin-like domain
MKFAKKKNLQTGEFVIHSPKVHWVKFMGPLLLFFIILVFFLVELLSNFGNYIPWFVSLGILSFITVYFLLQVLESVNKGYFITNKLLLAFIILCPILLLIRLFYYDIWFLDFSRKVIGNLQFILLTLTALSILHAIMQIAEYANEEYCITNKRLIIKKGIFSDNITDIPIEKLEGLSIIRGFWGSLFNYGTIRILGLGGARPCIITVKKPYAVRRKIDMVIEKNRAITVINEDHPKPVVKVKEEVIMPDIFSYGTLVRQLNPEKKDET